MKQKLSNLIFLLAILLGLIGLNNCNSKRSALQNLSGTYSDPKPYEYGKAFGHRTFTFQEGKWTLDFYLSFDPEGKQKIFSFRTLGNFKVLEESAEVVNAWNAVFYEDKKFLTLYSDDPGIKAAFRFQDCGLVSGLEKDISEAGCSAWKAVSECNEDHDLLMLSAEGGLHFGVRPQDNNMCTADKRPKALTPPVMKN
jgi:hypothetical protein